MTHIAKIPPRPAASLSVLTALTIMLTLGGCGGGGGDEEHSAAANTDAAASVPAAASGVELRAQASDIGGPITLQKFSYRTWKTVSAWCGLFNSTKMCGTLYAGTNYFYCQANSGTLGNGAPYHDGPYMNDWYAYTDLDWPRGARGWVSAVHFTVGNNMEPIPGLPFCNLN